MTCDAPVHTYVSYARGQCRCPAGREGHRLYLKQWREHRAPVRRIPALGYQRMVHALRAAGWPCSHIGALCQMNEVEVRRVDARTYILRPTADRLDRTYEKLADEDGPCVRTRNYAEQRGWAPPWAWDGIDIHDPGAGPNTDWGVVVDEVLVDRVLAGAAEYRDLNRDERALAFRAAQDRGWSGMRIQKDFRISGTAYAELREATQCQITL